MKKRIFTLMLSLVMITSATMSSNVYADDNNKFKDAIKTDVFVNVGSPVDSMYVPNKNVKDKEQYSQMLDSTINSNKITTMGGTYYISDRDTLMHNDKELYSEFSSSIKWSYINSSTVSGNSRVCWTGTSPFNADEITLTDKIVFAGAVVSVSASGPNWSTGWQHASWSASVSDNWEIDHVYSDVSCTGYDLYVKQTTTGDFKFGTTYYTTTAYDSQFL